MDIVSVTLEVKPMVPRNTVSLVTTIELAAPPEAQAASYDMNATMPGCGYFNASYRPGTIGATQGSKVNQYFMACGSPDSAGTGTSTAVDARAEADGNKIVIWAAIDSFPKEVREIGQLESISAATQIAEPLFGIIGNAALALPSDSAETDKTWKFS